MRIDISRTEARLALAGLAAFGFLHVLVPRPLLRAARRAYGLALAVEFTPREGAPLRVRLVGLCSLVASAIGWVLLDSVGDPPIAFSTSGSMSPSHDRRPIDDR